MGFQFDWMMEPSWSTEGKPVHDLFSKGSPFDDVGAFAYYASMGAVDPKAPFVEVPATMRMFGIGFGAAYVKQLPLAMLVSGIGGWFWDPVDRREGGLAELSAEPDSPDSYWSRGHDDPWSTW